MSPLSHPSSHLVMERPLPYVLPTWMMVPALTSRQEAQDAFFDVWVFYPNASNSHSTVTSSAYRQAKKREHVMDVEHRVFTPLVLSSTGGMGREATTFYKRLTDMTSQKRQLPYSVVMRWLKCRLSFASLRSTGHPLYASVAADPPPPSCTWDGYQPCHF